MSRLLQLARKASSRFALLGILCAVLLGAAGAWRHLAQGERGQALAFIADGQRALARGDRGAAVLSYERARWFAPRDKETEPIVPHTLRLVTTHEWLAIAVASGWIAGLGLAFLVVRRESRTRAATTWLALAAGSAFVLAMAGIMESRAYSLGVVTANEARVLVAPYSTATLEESLPSGSAVIVGSSFGGFRHVQLANGTAGWVEQPTIQTVELSGG
jgi:hypothetical protein